LDEQALKSGQLPADLKTLDEDTGANVVKQKDENMVSNNQNEADGEPNDVEEQRNDEPAPMEQVLTLSCGFWIV
jgi:U2 small nuclear ribonucleoprotein A'